MNEPLKLSDNFPHPLINQTAEVMCSISQSSLENKKRGKKWYIFLLFFNITYVHRHIYLHVLYHSFVPFMA